MFRKANISRCEAMPIALASVALLVVLLGVLFAPARAIAQTGTYVFDEQDVLFSGEFEELESQAKRYAETYNIGVYLLITPSMGPGESSGTGRNEFARDYFVSHELGVGANDNGIILVIANKSRKYVTVKHFVDDATDPFSNDCVNTMESDVTRQLKKNRWYAGASVYYSTIGEQMAYFAQNGTQWTKPHVIGPGIKIATTFIIPLLVAYAVVRNNRNAMKTARLQTEASDYLDRDSISLSVKTDTFLSSTISKVPRPKSNSGGGGGWTNMGGGFKGSGGGSF